MTYKIKKLAKTCEMCPSQWEGELEDGKSIIIRYRWGKLTIRTSYTEHSLWDTIEGHEVFTAVLGDALDGCIELDEVKNVVGNYIEFPDNVKYKSW